VSFWEIITSESYDTWFQEQTEDDKTTIFGKVYLLSEHGPMYSGLPIFLILNEKGCSLSAEIKKAKTKRSSIRI
jgi:hypothetical protein